MNSKELRLLGIEAIERYYETITNDLKALKTLELVLRRRKVPRARNLHAQLEKDIADLESASSPGESERSAGSGDLNGGAIERGPIVDSGRQTGNGGDASTKSGVTQGTLSFPDDDQEGSDREETKTSNKDTESGGSGHTTHPDETKEPKLNILGKDEALAVFGLSAMADWVVLEKMRREIVDRANPLSLIDIADVDASRLVEGAKRANLAFRSLLILSFGKDSPS